MTDSTPQEQRAMTEDAKAVLRTLIPYYPRHRGDEWVDEIHITTVPRFKQSDLSGDEWRTSAKVEILRKGVVLRERSYHDIKTAVAFLGSIAPEYPVGYDRDEPGWDASVGEALCFQPGCSEYATVEVRKLREACREGHVKSLDGREARVRWCDKHKHRGDASLDDADDNYEPLP
jgi:hypothetical protein